MKKNFGKKVGACVLAASMVLSMTACNSSTPSNTDTTTTTTTEAKSDSATEATSAEGTSAEGTSADTSSVDTGSAAPDWSAYDALIDEIRTTTDFAARVDLMHQAEDMLMDTWAVIPIYYYNDVYLQNTDVDGIFSTVFGMKFFMSATNESDPGNLKINIASEPDYLDPALTSSVDGGCLAVNTFAGLNTYNADGQLVPAVAESYDVSEDGTEYTFHLRESKWSNGEEVTANDFVYSWNRVIADETAADYSYLLDVIERKDDGSLAVDATDDYTLTVKLVAPCAYFLDLTAFPTFYPVYQAGVEAANPDGTNPGAWAQEAGFVSNGAFTLQTWNHNESMVYVKNDNYYDADKVTMNTLEFMLSDDDTAIYAAYNSGDLDFADTVPNDEIQSLLNNPEFHIVDNLGTYYAGFNVNSDMFAGKTVQQAADMRHAISLLIDRQYIVDTVGQTGQQLADTFVPIGMADGNGGVFHNKSYYDAAATGADQVEEAKALLEGAGYTFTDNGDGSYAISPALGFEYLTNTATSHVAIAESIQADLSILGIEVTIKQEDWNVFLADRKSGNYSGMCREGWLADYNDPVNMLEIFTSDSGNNDMQLGK